MSQSDAGLSCPEELELWTLDEVAECLSVPAVLYKKLWAMLADCKDKTPLGNDANETPDVRLDSTNDDKLLNAWSAFTDDEKRVLIANAESRL